MCLLSQGTPDNWLSLVLEIGMSESLPQLRADASWWYSNSDGNTRLVVLIHANYEEVNDWYAEIEIWTEVTQGRPDKVFERTQHTRLENGVLNGPILRLDFETLMCRPAQSNQEHYLELDQAAMYTQNLGPDRLIGRMASNRASPGILEI